MWPATQSVRSGAWLPCDTTPVAQHLHLATQTGLRRDLVQPTLHRLLSRAAPEGGFPIVATGHPELRRRLDGLSVHLVRPLRGRLIGVEGGRDRLVRVEGHGGREGRRWETVQGVLVGDVEVGCGRSWSLRGGGSAAGGRGRQPVPELAEGASCGIDVAHALSIGCATKRLPGKCQRSVDSCAAGGPLGSVPLWA